MSLFGAARLYVVSAEWIERDLAPLDVGSMPPHRDGAWALWAQMAACDVVADPLPPMWRVEPGPVHVAHGRSAPG